MRQWTSGRWAMGLVGLTMALLVGGWLASAGHAKDEPGGEPSLHDVMEEMDRGLRDVAKQVADPTKTRETLIVLAEVQSFTLTAKSKLPPQAKTLTGEERDRHIAAYRKRMVQLLGELLKLETAVIDGKTADAAAILKAIDGLRKEGHKQFMP